VADNAFSEDIDDEGFFTPPTDGIATATNYDYDAIGQLTKDEKEGIANIEWTLYGKIKKIIYNNGKPALEFQYDPSGNRVAKLLKNAVQPPVTDTTYTATYYWRDAQGNPMATESRTFNALPGTTPPVASMVTHPVEVEYNIYGSSRLGTLQDDIRYDVPTPQPYGIYYKYTAKRQYELTNHLGNVTATVSDNKTYDVSGTDYDAAVISAQQYYPFGMQMPGRQHEIGTYGSLGKYRFGYNGKEKDDEVKGIGNSLDFTERIYDPRVSRWFSPDILSKKQPGWSSYKGYYDNPILFVDPDGNAEYTFAVRRFEHSSLFGFPFLSKGDDRQASMNINKSARCHQYVTIETNTDVGKDPITINQAFSSPTRQYTLWPGKGTEIPSSEATGTTKDFYGSKFFNINLYNSGTQPVAKRFCAACTPAIDTKGYINVVQDKNSLAVSGFVYGDDFPDGEAMIYDHSGQGISLGTYYHGISGTPMKDLWGVGNDIIIKFDIKISTDKDGNFVSAQRLVGNKYENVKIYSPKQTNFSQSNLNKIKKKKDE
jgi:RHS repeat-associated protein